MSIRAIWGTVFVTTSKPSTVSKGILEHNGFVLCRTGMFLGRTWSGRHRIRMFTCGWLLRQSKVSYSDIHFVDDQVAHLESALGLGVNCYLAAYGYTTGKQVDRARGLGY